MCKGLDKTNARIIGQHGGIDAITAVLRHTTDAGHSAALLCTERGRGETDLSACVRMCIVCICIHAHLAKDQRTSPPPPTLCATAASALSLRRVLPTHMLLSASDHHAHARCRSSRLRRSPFAFLRRSCRAWSVVLAALGIGLFVCIAGLAQKCCRALEALCHFPENRRSAIQV